VGCASRIGGKLSSRYLPQIPGDPILARHFTLNSLKYDNTDSCINLYVPSHNIITPILVPKAFISHNYEYVFTYLKTLKCVWYVSIRVKVVSLSCISWRSRDRAVGIFNPQLTDHVRPLLWRQR
jgi:hypothetical protein